MTLNDIKTQQDKLFDEKFGSHTSLGFIQTRGREACKEYLASRDLAIENAVRAESVEIVQKRIEEEENEDRCAEQESRVWLLQEVLALLTTSPSR